MTEDIKEILEEIRIIIYYNEIQNIYKETQLDYDSSKKLLNYITNLQKENEDLEEVINIKEHQLATMIENKTDYTMTNILELKIMKLQNEKEELLKKLENVSLDEANIRADILLEQQDYKQRNEKAVEYIENHTENIDRGTYYEDYVETYDLLNILKGGDE